MKTDFFLLIPGIKGESADHKYANSIDIDSIGWDLKNSGTTHYARGGGSGKVEVDSISLTKLVDRSTPNLIKACCTGRHFDKASVIVRKAGEKPLEYLRFELESVFINRVSQGGKSSNDQVKETVYLSFSSFRTIYTPQSETGGMLAKVEGGFRIAENIST
ncbi:Hcp family type VI secretion system effector [Limnobacter parvus]|uniref:Type VI secretion system tube protein Hcp n=1 Tax=Limnobacter parvus TaxID=2939690 RepID=A0ABT1XI86_9BURK|nr:type VI secretion system tube protein Hcp [Limnobacter parvus]MCR2746298.1 type VI secretion system tube protein Hcp [Limnobacter parvus]